MTGENIYKKLEIKDYGYTYEFIHDVMDRQQLCEGNDTIMIFGDRQFIEDCIFLLMDHDGCVLIDDKRIEYKLALIDLYFDDNEFISDEYVLYLQNSKEVQNRVLINTEPIRSELNSEYVGKVKMIGEGYTRAFFNQDCVEQDLIDECLRWCDEVMLFGIESNGGYEDDDESAVESAEHDDNECNEHCPWWGECEFAENP